MLQQDKHNKRSVKKKNTKSNVLKITGYKFKTVKRVDTTRMSIQEVFVRLFSFSSSYLKEKDRKG